jgi:subtilisin family serine protease
MKRAILSITLLLAFLAATPASADNRYIVRTTGGLSSVLHLCLSAGCQVQGSLDGPVGQTYLVTSAGDLIANLLNGLVNFLEALLGIQSVEPDQILPIPQVPVSNPASGLYDTAPVNYYGTVVWHGYAAQPATHIIRLTDAQRGFNISGMGIVADIDTGVDPNHPVLRPVLLPGYDFTRNQPGGSEMNDLPGGESTTASPCEEDCPTGTVTQHSIAMVDQHSIAMVDQPGFEAFGHGTMVAGVLHLVAPHAKILPLKAFRPNGTGNLADIIHAIYYATQNHANVINMSFDLSGPSQALSQAVSYANHAGVILVAAAGNESTSARVYPAAFNGHVVGIASTTDWDTRSSFSNYGTADVWIAAPGENVISTFPGGTYASASGTSFSSPLVAGTAALLLNAKPALNQTNAASALTHAIQLTPDLNHGRLDVYQAVSAWVNNSSSTTSSGSTSSGSCFLLCL